MEKLLKMKMAAEGGSAAIKREDVPIGICSKEGLSGYGSLVWGGGGLGFGKFFASFATVLYI